MERGNEGPVDAVWYCKALKELRDQSSLIYVNPDILRHLEKMVEIFRYGGEVPKPKDNYDKIDWSK